MRNKNNHSKLTIKQCTDTDKRQLHLYPNNRCPGTLLKQVLLKSLTKISEMQKKRLHYLEFSSSSGIIFLQYYNSGNLVANYDNYIALFDKWHNFDGLRANSDIPHADFDKTGSGFLMTTHKQWRKSFIAELNEVRLKEIYCVIRLQMKNEYRTSNHQPAESSDPPVQLEGI